MSTQSGITVSDALLDAFRQLKGPLVIAISPDQTQLVPDSEFTASTGSTGSLGGGFDAVQTYLESIYPEPRYVILRDEPQNVFVSFIPDDAPIRQKMLYASTKNTLLTTLGLSLFSTFAWTELDELTLEYYKKASSTGDRPLTEEEQRTLAIDALEASGLGTLSYYKRELASMHKTASTTSATAGNDGLLYAFEPELTDALSDISSSTVVAFGINDPEKKIVLKAVKNSVSTSSLISTLQSTTDSQPVYAVYKHEFKGPVFIYACPLGSRVKDRMLYASFKLDLLTHLKRQGLEFAHSFEVGDIDELELSELETEASTPVSDTSRGSTPSVTSDNSRLRFSKPKGPRRR